MLDQNLTKKEEYDLNKNAERGQQARSQKTRGLKRGLMWSGIFVVLIGAVWGLTKLSNNPGDIQEAVIISGVTAEDWVEGNKESQITLIEYGDFQCPACGAYFPLVEKLMDEHGDSFKFAYRHFPLQQHPNAKPAAYAAEAAGKQGKFWEMFDMIFVHQNDWSGRTDAEDIFLQYAETLGLNIEQFKNDRDSDVVKEDVEKDYDSGVANKVNATPTFFLNGKKIQPRDYDEFVSLIEQASQTDKN
ncbi:MAG: thioredoxin domain-containing protein [Candidatus Yanofskybacteria bacterium]|nr:thioredoxin domain-containing protein [Candidatus Yanofskybacteria bacterium]